MKKKALSLAFSFFFFKAPSDREENWTSEFCRVVWPEEETSQVLLGPK